MARAQSYFVCNQCGASYNKWAGKCESCGAWNSISEEVSSTAPPAGKGAKPRKGREIELGDLTHDSTEPSRFQSQIGELDRVLGGGLVPGAAILIAGDPGIGKSTILLQLAAAIAMQGKKTIYISGEEALAQLRMRARRLNLSDAPVKLAAETNIADIRQTLASEPQVDVVIIDSVQTMWSPSIEAAPGTVSQVRTAAQELIHFAKKNNTTLILVGHVTKEGQIAGPRVLEHMVDSVIYFEADRGDQYRILRAIKNRFGPAHEMGVFEMRAEGLVEVQNPSALFLENREKSIAGAAVFAGIEGTRPMLMEIQALAAPSSLATPRRAVVGWDSARLSMILAVLEARFGISFAGHDVFLNIAGGLRITEPAADLAVAAALISSRLDKALPPHHILFGEIALSGAIRPVAQPALRLKEAAKLGFTDAIIPASTPTNAKTQKETTIDTAPISDLSDIIAIIGGNNGAVNLS